MKKITLVLLYLLASVFTPHLTAHASIILLEDFEDNNLTYTSDVPDALNDLSNNDYFGIVSANSLTSHMQYQQVSGTQFYGVQDTDGAKPTSSSAINLLWSSVDISLWENLQLSWLIAEDNSTDGFEDFDSNTQFSIAAQIDGAGFFDLFSVIGSGTNTAPLVDTNFDGVGDGIEITDTFTQFSANLSQGSLLDIKVSFLHFNAADEDFAFDNLMLVGDLKSSNQGNLTVVSEPSIMSLLILFLVAFSTTSLKSKRNSQ